MLIIITTCISCYNSLLLLFICFLGNSSHMIGPKGAQISGFDGGHPGDIIRKFGEDWIV